MDKKIISKALVDLTKYYINAQIPFSLSLINDPKWGLPEYLDNPDNTLTLVMENTDLEESYTETGDIELTLGIDDVVYNIQVDSHHIQAVGPKGSYLLAKQFKEEPSVEEAIEGSMARSMKLFRLHNPDLFTPSPGAA